MFRERRTQRVRRLRPTSAAGSSRPPAVRRAGRRQRARRADGRRPRVDRAGPGTEVTGTLANGTIWVAEYPQSWNGTLILYSHGYGALTAADAPDADTQ